ncbi:MAG: RelA/SpoT domain-containing protein [Magnetococcales bacterium]|nr:RelA/SpoT domain-containing protein [Magnetococcales bacterium]
MTTTERIVSEYLKEKDTYDEFLVGMTVIIREIARVNKFDTYQVHGRVKDLGNLVRKIATMTEGTMTSVREIGDLMGVRVVVFYSQEIPLLIDKITENFSVLENHDPKFLMEADPVYPGYPMHRMIVQIAENRRKLIEYERFVGYKFEVQICSIMQHAWEKTEKSLGYFNKAFPKEKVREYTQLAYLMELYDGELNLVRDFLTPVTHQVKLDTSAPTEGAKRKGSLVRPLTPEEKELDVMGDGQAEDLDDLLLAKITLAGTHLPVDAKSLENFVLTSDLIRYVERSLSGMYDTRLAYDQNAGDILLQAVQSVPVLGTIADLEQSLHRDCKKIFRMAQNIFGTKQGNRHEYIIKGVSVFLMLYLLIARQGDLGLLRQFLEKYSFDQKLVNKGIIRMLLEYASAS